MSERDETADDLPDELTRSFRVRWVRIERVKRYSNNPRRNEQAVAKVRASLDEFGWRQPIVVDGEYVIVVGDTRYLAAVERGDAAVPVHIATDLTPEQIRAYRIADNRVHEESEWDDEKLTEELEQLVQAGADLSMTGMDDDELEKLLDEATEPELTPVDVKPLPTMTWILVGIPSTRYIEIAEEIERMSLVPEIFLELTANSDHASAHRKAAQLTDASRSKTP